MWKNFSHFNSGQNLYSNFLFTIWSSLLFIFPRFFFLFNSIPSRIFMLYYLSWAKLVCSLFWYMSILRFFFLSFLMWTSFLKSLLNLLLIQYCFCFSFLACGILAPRQRIKPALPALEDEVLTISSNIGEVPIFLKHFKKQMKKETINGNFIWPAKSKISNILDLST